MQEELIKKATQYIANTYTRFPIAITRGEGCWLWDINGRRYLDFLAGIAVCNLGHAHEKVVEGLIDTGKKAVPRVEPLLHGAAGKGGPDAR